MPLTATSNSFEISWFQRLSDIQSRGSANKRTSARIAFGVRGDADTLFGLGKDWNYEVSYVWGRTRLRGLSLGSVSTEGLYNALPGEKDLVWCPGGHYDIGPDVIRAAEQWLKAKL